MAAALPIVAAVTGLIGAGSALYGATRKTKIPKLNAPPEPPEIPDVAKTTAVDIKKKRGRASTILTRPGSLDEASAIPTLLGQ